jgi:hypothetical protein
MNECQKAWEESYRAFRTALRKTAHRGMAQVEAFDAAHSVLSLRSCGGGDPGELARRIAESAGLRWA